MARFICYSTASANALSFGGTIDEALARAARMSPTTDFLVVAEVRGDRALEDFDILPRGARIVFRGANELAQRFRAAT